MCCGQDRVRGLPLDEEVGGGAAPDIDLPEPGQQVERDRLRLDGLERWLVSVYVGQDRQTGQSGTKAIASKEQALREVATGTSARAGRGSFAKYWL